MKHSIQKLSFLLVFSVLFGLFSFGIGIPTSAETEVTPISDATGVGAEEGSLGLNCKSAILMESKTGAILYTQNADESMNPASVTKIMTLLLIMEAIDDGRIRLSDTVTVSETAASMGGSQVYLKVGEQMILEDLLKSIVIASANDAAVAVAEYLYGNVPAFVEKMNQKAMALGMKNTNFENVTGLDDTAENHVTSARDIAIMSRELIKYPTILQYSSIWMDTIRNGEFGLTNTNRLVRFYPGCTGLKTGSTSKAGFCVSVTAERGDLSLICVIMGAESRDIRNAVAASLLDWGFASFGFYKAEPGICEPISVVGGNQRTCSLRYGGFSCVLPKGDVGKIEVRAELPESIATPTKEGDTIGHMVYMLGGKEIGRSEIVAGETVEKINFFNILKRMTVGFLLI